MHRENKNISDIENSFIKLVESPELFISSEEKFTNDLRLLLKHTYDLTKVEEPLAFNSNSPALPELIIQNFDLEQIWQQVELQNNNILDKAVPLISKHIIHKEKLLLDNDESKEYISEENIDNLNSENNESSSVQSDNEEEISDSKSDDLEHSDKEDEKFEEEHVENKNIRQSEVDDKFFKLHEMNNFLAAEEKKVNSNKNINSDDESEDIVDMFESGSDEEEEHNIEGNDKKRNPRYKDFFGTKTQQNLEREQYILSQFDNDKENSDNESNDENNDDLVPNIKSSLEMREERLKDRIKEMEEAAVSEKPWQLKGEVMADNRPQNSLLEEVLEFDLVSRPAPVITESTTFLLEDVIKQRIKDKAFDDVERKEKPVDTPLEYKKKLMLNQEKSKESLAQIYEKEFIEKREALNSNENEKDEEEPPLHKEIKTMMHNLFSKLDALSNFHFTPKPAAPELKVVSNLPAINMEEVAPVAASNAALLAPEEVRNKTKGEIIGKAERTIMDKKRERRVKKRKQREHVKEKTKKEKIISKLNPGLGNKYSKEKAKKMLEQVTKTSNVDKMDQSIGSKSVKSSTAFFTQLQDEVQSHITNKTKTKKKIVKNFNAKKLKL